MGSEKKRKSKSNSLLNILEREFSNGAFHPDTFFFSKDELAKNYHISPMTAHKIIKQLEAKGYLKCSRGRRTKVNHFSNVHQKRLQLPHPVGFVTLTNLFTDKAEWYDWIMHLTQRDLLKDGNTSILLPFVPDTNPEQIAGTCSAIILIQNDNYKKLLTRYHFSIPVITLSFTHPYPDSVFIDYRHSLDLLLMYLIRKKTCKIFFVANSALLLEKLSRWNQELDFFSHAALYGYTEKHFESICINPDKPEGILREKVENISGHFVFFILQNIMPGDIKKEMSSCGKAILQDYDIVSYTKPLTESYEDCSYIDISCEAVTTAITEQLYSRIDQNQPIPAKIIHPTVNIAT